MAALCFTRDFTVLNKISIFICSILMFGCNSEKIVFSGTQSYLSDSEFKSVYLTYIEANSRYLRSFSSDSKEKLLGSLNGLKPFVENKNPVALYSYGTGMYLIDEDSNRLKTMLEESAKTGYLPATRKVIQFLRTGQHFQRNIPLAFEMSKKITSYGHDSDIRVFLIFNKVHKFIDSSSDFIRKLELSLESSTDVKGLLERAGGGELVAQRILGHLYYHQKYGIRDLVESAYWLTIASNNIANDQAAYDSGRALYAISTLKSHELSELNRKLDKNITKSSTRTQ